MRMADIYAGSAVVTRKVNARQMLGSRCAAELLRAADLLDGSQVVRSRSIRALQSLFDVHRAQRLVGRFVGQVKFLPGRKPDGPGQQQFLLSIVIARNNELLLASLKFDLRAKSVDRRHYAGILLITSLGVKSLCGFKLGLGSIHSRRGGNG